MQAMARGTGSSAHERPVVPLGAIAVCAALVGCYRWVDVPPEHAVALSAERMAERAAVVPTLDRELRKIEEYDAVIVRSRRWVSPDRWVERSDKFREPVRVALDGECLLVEDLRHGRVYSLSEVKRVTARELALDRTAIVLTTAAVAGVLAGWATWSLTRCGDDPSDTQPSGCVLGLMLASGGAAGATLVITMPLTRPLGTRVGALQLP